MSSYMKKYKRKFEIFKIILNKDDPTIVEIGSHYGEDTLRFLEAFSNCTIYCFEPDPRNIKMFKKYVNDERAKLFESALSTENGTATFYQSYQPHEEETPEKYDWISTEDYKKEKLNNSGSSSLKKGYQYTLEETITVKTERFDDWYENVSPGTIDLAWIDVQGAEKDVILGMGSQVKNIKFIWMEYGEDTYDGAMGRIETIELMESLGFSVVDQLSSKTHAGDLLFRRV